MNLKVHLPVKSAIQIKFEIKIILALLQKFKTKCVQKRFFGILLHLLKKIVDMQKTLLMIQ